MSSNIKIKAENYENINEAEPKYLTEYEELLKNASDWNGLIHWARKARGPYLDSNTYTFQVPKNSMEYYTGVEGQQKMQEKVNQERFDFFNRPPATDDSDDDDGSDTRKKGTFASSSTGVSGRRGRPPKHQFQYQF